MVRKEYMDLLKEIGMSGNMTPRMLEILQKLRDEFDEREGMLRRYGETRVKDDPEGYEQEEKKIRSESRADDVADGGERRDAYGVEIKGDATETPTTEPVDAETVSKAEYDRLRQMYLERFFSSPEEAIKDQEEDVKKDSNLEDIDFDDLFKEREG